jgi:hypothetical protein
MARLTPCDVGNTTAPVLACETAYITAFVHFLLSGPTPLCGALPTSPRSRAFPRSLHTPRAVFCTHPAHCHTSSTCATALS